MTTSGRNLSWGRLRHVRQWWVSTEQKGHPAQVWGREDKQPDLPLSVYRPLAVNLGQTGITFPIMEILIPVHCVSSLLPTASRYRHSSLLSPNHLVAAPHCGDQTVTAPNMAIILPRLSTLKNIHVNAGARPQVISCSVPWGILGKILYSPDAPMSWVTINGQQ